MKRIITILLLVVVIIFSCTYSLADEIDLTKMSTKELQELRQRINKEIQSRPEEVEPEDEKDRRRRIEEQYYDWLDAYDFDSVLKDIDSGDSGLSDKCAQDLKEKAIKANELLQKSKMESDPFTGEFRITYPLLKDFADGCQVYPYIDNDDFKIIMGFPYDESLHYDLIYVKFNDEEIYEIERFDKNRGFSLQFETLYGKSWEYSIIDSITIYDGETIEAISFREDGSIKKENYVLSEEEKEAVSVIGELADLKDKMHYRLLDWNLTGE